MFLWCVYFVVIFVFKQKTAYEMRISDWSSDVCSSDLVISCRQPLLRGKGFAHHIRFQNLRNRLLNCWLIEARILCSEGADDGIARLLRLHLCHLRSEEHTSELQSLMRISYAVFCLKKKIIT